MSFDKNYKVTVRAGSLDLQAQRHREIVLRAYAAQAIRDWDSFYAVFDADIQFIEADSLPYGGIYHGLDGFREGTAIMLGYWDPFKAELVEVTVGGDLAILCFEVTGVARATGTSVDFPLTSLWRFRDEKVIEVRPFYFDTAMICQVLGVASA